ncbi:MAG: M23 family metallopeptidase [Candidatus Margulisbacteria bacterium]|nr:M23 family metallopeptidase [Candidatus Margulisiibacteriota bacterium]
MKKIAYIFCLLFICSLMVIAEQNPWVLKIYPAQDVFQGESVVITAQVPPGTQSKDLFINVFDTNYSLYLVKENEYRLPLGIHMDKNPGNYKVVLVYKNQQKSAFFLNVKKKAYKISTIYLNQKNKQLITSKNLFYESNLIGSLFKKVKTTLYYGQKNFVKPAPGKITSDYGMGRKYQDTQGKIVDTWRHRGVDIASSSDKRVLAANGGQVILANMFQVHGGTIMIDHGQGIISIYAHLGKLLVKNGEQVKRGQSIAELGSTGVSTGPHVHFGLSVANVRVNPMQWVDRPMIR